MGLKITRNKKTMTIQEAQMIKVLTLIKIKVPWHVEGKATSFL